MPIKFVLVGCGHIAQRHAYHICGHANAELIGVCDLDSEKAKKFANKYGVKAVASFHDLLNLEADIVVICTPSGLHKTHALESFKFNRNVLVEKPMAINYKDALEMKIAAKNSGKELFVVKQNRYNPPVQRVKLELDNGNFGDIFQVVVNCFWNRDENYYKDSKWKGTKSLDGGVLYNQFSHFIDIVYYLFGSLKEPKGIVRNCNHKSSTEFEDSGNFSFVLGDSTLGSLNFSTNSFGQNMEGSITIIAEKATLKIGGKYLNAIEYLKSDTIKIKDLPLSAPANNYGHYEGSMSNHDKIIDNVVKTLLGEEKIMTNASDGVEVVKMIENLYSSATVV